MRAWPVLAASVVFVCATGLPVRSGSAEEPDASAEAKTPAPALKRSNLRIGAERRQQREARDFLQLDTGEATEKQATPGETGDSGPSESSLDLLFGKPVGGTDGVSGDLMDGFGAGRPYEGADVENRQWETECSLDPACDTTRCEVDPSWCRRFMEERR